MNTRKRSLIITFVYFAYGSNMLTDRLKKRCPSSIKIGRAYADDRIIEFSKLSKDGSGKATLQRRAGHQTPGVLFRISKAELGCLDAYEGAGNGYDRYDIFPVHLTRNSEIVCAKTYLASCPKLDLKPYDWYLALVIAGVLEHGLDDNHLAKLRCVPYLLDPNCRREGRCEALEVLGKAGFPDYRCLLRPG